MELSSRIAHIRKQMGLSQEKFGELFNMSQRSVAAWESGERTPSYPVLLELADKLGVSVDYLVGRSEAPKIKKEPTASGSELMENIISQVQTLSEPELIQVSAFLSGLAVGRGISAAAQAAPDPASESPE